MFYINFLLIKSFDEVESQNFCTRTNLNQKEFILVRFFERFFCDGLAFLNPNIGADCANVFASTEFL